MEPDRAGQLELFQEAPAATSHVVVLASSTNEEFRSRNTQHGAGVVKLPLAADQGCGDLGAGKAVAGPS